MLYNTLKEYSQSGIYPFHMPGHKRNDINGDKILPYNIDLTEICGFDNLHNPSGIIKSVQDKAKILYNSDFAFLLVNGATGGILAAICALTNYGDKVLVARNCHKSVFNAVELCGLDAEYILPEPDPEFGVFSSIDPELVETKLSQHKDIKAVIITSPTYEGVVSDVKLIAKICRKYNSKLFVDESHGAHFPFSDIFPSEALSCGADASVLSLHKTLPSLTQTALLITNDRTLADKLSENLSVFESSSPSYILMSSIEQCLNFVENAAKAFDEYKHNLLSFLNDCKKLKKLKILSEDSFFTFDKSKIVISTACCDINGIQLAKLLRGKYKIETEMAYTNYIIAMTSVCDTKQGFDLLKNALFEIDSSCNLLPNNVNFETGSAKLPLKAFKASERYKYNPLQADFNCSAGNISLEYIWAYPPGIPLVVPGEIISEDIINQIHRLLQNDIEIFSTNKNMPCKITVAEN